ncbi:MAG: glycosyltransferase, partial [Deltaproteobacteria bacterium]|nr:glycosyltransferase [Deltaproteobacteria bacterium]
IGDGNRLQHAKDLAVALKINDRVEFMGRIIATEEIFARHQAYILISKWEGLPRSIIEAMRAGMPVIASDVGGCSEEIKDGINGFLIPRENLKTLVSKLSLLTSNPDLRLRMGNKSRYFYEKNFTFKKMYRENVRVYKEIIMEQHG